jgi:hypothetical protein
LQQISGDKEFNEVFFDSVFVPARELMIRHLQRSRLISPGVWWTPVPLAPWRIPTL